MINIKMKFESFQLTCPSEDTSCICVYLHIYDMDMDILSDILIILQIFNKITNITDIFANINYRSSDDESIFPPL